MGRNELPVTKLSLWAGTENLASRRVAEKLGFRLVDHRMELYGVALNRDR